MGLEAELGLGPRSSAVESQAALLLDLSCASREVPDAAAGSRGRSTALSCGMLLFACYCCSVTCVLSHSCRVRFLCSKTPV